jgi:hypothetical protein
VERRSRDVRDAPSGKGVKRIPVEGITRGHASGSASKADPDVPLQDDIRARGGRDESVSVPGSRASLLT